MGRPRFDLADLLGNYSVEEFLSDNWNNEPKPQLFETSQQVKEFLGEIEELHDTAKLSAIYLGKVSLLSRDKGATEATASEVEEAIESGWTSYFRNVEHHITALKEITETLSNTLGVGQDNLSVEVFVAKAGSGASMHADYDSNFAYLLKGEKDWKLAPNDAIQNPPAVVLPRSHKQVLEVEEIVNHEDLPEAMPDKSIQIKATENTTLFLPRNWWHETHSKLDTTQVNFVIKGPQVVDFVANVIRDMFSKDFRYRAFIDFSSQHSIEKNLKIIGTMLVELGLKDESVVEEVSSKILEAGRITR